MMRPHKRCLSYQDLGLPISTKKDEGDWTRLTDELDRLRAAHREVVAQASNK
jgi:hypothetical protein